MEMLAPTAVVADYLDRHEVWFERCAAPIQVTALDQQSYGLTLGRFGNFGFEIEPTISLRLLPQDQLIYRIETTDLAWGDPTLRNPYEVDFQARMELKPWAEAEGMDPGLATAVSWDLDLSVWIRLPQVITVLPDGLVQSSGDHLLRQIVRQVSRRLTWKVQEDFHGQYSLKCPPRRRAAF
jgi:hypothetical protein|tara:strand:- start:7 stop:549 length:543 start_codon:yes stop_codon:yes gene_type:complete